MSHKTTEKTAKSNKPSKSWIELTTDKDYLDNIMGGADNSDLANKVKESYFSTREYVEPTNRLIQDVEDAFKHSNFPVAKLVMDEVVSETDRPRTKTITFVAKVIRIDGDARLTDMSYLRTRLHHIHKQYMFSQAYTCKVTLLPDNIANVIITFQLTPSMGIARN